MLEKKLINEGNFLIAGVDEAGRGALAGPVVASAVAFDREIIKRKKMLFGSEVKDSKLLSPAKRKYLFEKITALAFVSVAQVPARTIDKINILQASLLAMKKAVLGLLFKPDILLIDGPQKIDINLPQIPIINGDNLCFTISCASIIAKVFRDNLMGKMGNIFPQYKFCQHKGYGTFLHRELLKEYGLSPIHRLSFSPCRIC
jgi:ribonuclease HII